MTQHSKEYQVNLEGRKLFATYKGPTLRLLEDFSTAIWDKSQQEVYIFKTCKETETKLISPKSCIENISKNSESKKN